MSLKRLKLSGCDINFDTPNRNEILRNGLRRASSESVLGRGTFGLVFKAIYKGEQVAVKIVNNNNDENKRAAVECESNVLHWDHKNIIRILHIECTTTYSAVIMERFQGQCLQSILDQIELSLPHRFRISQDIICGLNYCHKNGILHLDIKPQNILVEFDAGRNALYKYLCKLCDFGSSKSVDDANGSTTKQSVGTIRYMSPEALKNGCLTAASDIYSFGITMWQLKSRISPYFNIDCNEAVAYKVVKNDLRPITPSEEIENCFQFNNPHHNCLCQHFSSEISNSEQQRWREETIICSSIKHSLSSQLSKSFRKLHTNTSHSSNTATMTTNKISLARRTSSRELLFGLNFDIKTKSNQDTKDLRAIDSPPSRDQNNSVNLEQIFFNCSQSACDLKEQNYKAIYIKCWNSVPDARPSGVQIENSIRKIVLN